MALGGLLARVIGITAARAEHYFVTSGAAARIGTGIGSGVNAITSNASTVVFRELGYQVEAAATNHIADPSQIMWAYWQGLIDQQEVKEWLGYNGVPFNGFGAVQPNANTDFWRRVLLGTKPHLDVSTVVDFYRQSVLDIGQARSALAQAGWSSHQAQNVFLRDKGWYDTSVAADLWRGGFITEDQYRRALERGSISEPLAQADLLRLRTPLPIGNVYTGFHLGTLPMTSDIAPYASVSRQLQLHGYGGDLEQSLFLNQTQPYGALVATGLYWRGLIGDEEYRRELAADGIVGQQRQAVWVHGVQPIPTGPELVTLAVREAWDDDASQRFGYDQEFPPAFDYWMRQQGWSWSARPAQGPGAEGAPLTWPQAYWRAHWVPMAPGQAYVSFHSLTPQRVAELQGLVPGLREFTWGDLSESLRIADYAPEVRKWLAAASFQTIELRQSRQVYHLGVRNRAWFLDQMRRRGLSPADAETLVELEDARRLQGGISAAEAFARKAERDVLARIMEGYRLGTIGRDQAVDMLRRQGVEFDAPENAINAAAAQENLAVVRDGLARLKRGYLAGEFAPAELPTQLALFGLQVDAIGRYITRWNIARSQHRRMLSTERIVKYVGEGKLTPAVGMVRLTNLGWVNADALLLLAEAQTRAAELAIKAKKAQDQTRTRRQKELESVVKEGKRIVAQTQAQLRRETPIKVLKAWVCEAIVSPQWAGERLRAMGYSDALTEDYVKQWASENAADKHCLPPKSPNGEPPAAPPPPPAAPPPSGVIPPQIGGKIGPQTGGKIGE